MMCWENVTKPLEHCIISAHNNNSSNVLTHLKRNHKDLPLLGSDVSTVTDSLANKSAAAWVQNQSTQYTQIPNDIVVGSPQIALNHLYTFFNEANIAIKQANNPSLNMFIEYLLDHVTTLKKADCQFSCYKYKKYELNQFHLFLGTVQYLVKYLRDFYKKTKHELYSFSLCFARWLGQQ
jgi:hypothetical protein